MSKSKTTVRQFDPNELETKEPSTPERNLDTKMHEDVTTDPEGAATRRNPDAGQSFPGWVFGDFEESKTNYWGSKWADGRSYLIPRKATVGSIMAIHEDGLDNLVLIAERAKKEDETTYQALQASYTGLICVVPSRHHFSIIRGLGDAVTTLLGERAYAKYRYIQALESQRPDDNSNTDYVDDIATKMQEASYDAAMWWSVHQDAWKEAEFRHEPKYPRVENAIAMRLINVASYVEKKHRITNTAKPVTDDYKKLVSDF